MDSPARPDGVTLTDGLRARSRQPMPIPTRPTAALTRGRPDAAAGQAVDGPSKRHKPSSPDEEALQGATHGPQGSTHRPGNVEAALRQQVQNKISDKSEPYESRHGFKNVRLNTRVFVTPSAGDSAGLREPVVCRHLATMFARHTQSKSKLMPEFSTAEGITRVFEGYLDTIGDLYDDALVQLPAGCKALLQGNHFGQYLQSMAILLDQAAGQPGGPSQSNCLLITPKHAMALHMERKTKHSVPYFVARLYDPNSAASYMRVVKANPEGFSELTLESMMLRPQSTALYASGSVDGAAPIAAVSLDERLQPIVGNRCGLSPASLYVAMRLGLRSDVERLLAESEKAHPSTQAYIEALQARVKLNDDKSAPALHIALQFGQADAVDLYSRTVIATPRLDHSTKVELLAARRFDGVPGLYMALRNGHRETIAAFAQAVLSSDLTFSDKADLLAAKKVDGSPGLFVAFFNGHAQAITSLANAIVGSSLEPQTKADLLAAKRAHGCPGLFMAFYKGHEDAVSSFARVILASDLDRSTQADLLAARRAKGWPGPYAAFRKGHRATIESLVRELVTSSRPDLMVGTRPLAEETRSLTLRLIAAYRQGDTHAAESLVRDVLTGRP